MERDPVCGMLVDPKEAAGARDYQDTTYYFCSPSCVAKFDEAPQRYLETRSPPPKPST
ncbi:MAG TPA: YHS domain-containing protein [Burkholderiales bacterium]|nr:YHS domain-containing protein [Burkholderiales bacterium]